MTRFFYILCILLYVILSFAACRKSVSGPTRTGPANFTDVFDQFWEGMNTHYVYWDIDTTHWDAIYQQYRPLFARLDLQDAGDVRASVQLFRDMTKGLIDGHYAIRFYHSLLTDSTIDPAYDRKRSGPAFHEPYSFAGLAAHYLDPGYMSGYDSTTDAHQLLYALSGTIGQRVLYFTCNRMALLRSYQSPSGNGVRPVLQSFFDHLAGNSFDMKGLIIDLRDNGGGDLIDLGFLVGRIIDQRLLFGYTRYRNGNGRLDHSSWLEAAVSPSAGAKKISAPIIVLADNFSASTSEAMIMALRCLPNTTIVGENTWGATGPFTDENVYNDGPFSIPGFLSVNTSSVEFKHLDGRIYEGVGFPPDIAVPFDLSSINAGIDRQLEKGISLIK
ncbi:MAG: hypothetical protein J0H74_06670 [Chitinophagaceae bacterium]|nr:hypothetical protein [Chitinophagaceae bacterium]